MTTKTSEQKAKHAAVERERRKRPEVRDYNRQVCKKRYVANKQEYKDAANNSRRKLRQEMIEAYGGECACCAENIYEFLNLDHKFGGGGKERKTIDRYSLFWRLKREGWPKDKYQLLCFNCNIAIGNFGICPHKASI